MRTDRILLAVVLLILGAWGAAQCVRFNCGCAYKYDPVLQGYHQYAGLWLGCGWVEVAHGVTSNGNWVYNNVPHRWARVSRVDAYTDRTPWRGPGIGFDPDWTFRWVYLPYWLLALPPVGMLAWRWWMRWWRARKTVGRGFEITTT